MSKVVIQFKKASGNYTQGDVAGFPQEQAERYVNAKFAEYIDAKPEKPNGKTETKPETKTAKS